LIEGLPRLLASLESGWTDDRRLRTFITTLVLSSDEVLLATRGLFDEGRFQLDEKLVSDLYRASPADLKIALVSQLAFTRLKPAVFESLFRDVWRLPMTLLQRQRVAWALAGYFKRNPDRAEAFRPLILDLLRSNRKYFVLAGLGLVRHLNELEPGDLERIKQRMNAAWSHHRMNAINGLCELVKRHREVSPAVVAFATSPELRAIARRIQRTDPDKDARTCAYYLLKAIREYDARGTKAKKPPRRAHRR
jgi:hypothetical protein